jgi:hypothetical protein
MAAMILSLENTRIEQNPSQTSPNIVDWLHLWFTNVTNIIRTNVILLVNMEPV